MASEDDTQESVVRVDNLRVAFGGARSAAVGGVDVCLAPGRALTIVGESGAGKSQLALAIARLSPPEATVTGRVWWGATDLLALPPQALRAWRGARIGMVFQDPSVALAPHLSIGRQLSEVLEAHAPKMTRAEVMEQALACLRDVQLSEPARRLAQYPHELSGGMLQRVMIAMALIGKPQLLILDEPTSALDASARQEIVSLLDRLRARGISLLCITHDVGVAAHLGDDLAVMLGGQLVETGPTAAILSDPKHPYTRALLASRITLQTPRVGVIPTLREAAPVQGGGCVFASRCDWASSVCQTPVPPHSLGQVQVRCHQPWLGKS